MNIRDQHCRFFTWLFWPLERRSPRTSRASMHGSMVNAPLRRQAAHHGNTCDKSLLRPTQFGASAAKAAFTLLGLAVLGYIVIAVAQHAPSLLNAASKCTLERRMMNLEPETPDRSDKAIASPGQRLDPALASGCLRQHTPDRIDLHREVAFFNHDARPRGLDDVAFWTYSLLRSTSVARTAITREPSATGTPAWVSTAVSASSRNDPIS